MMGLLLIHPVNQIRLLASIGRETNQNQLPWYVPNSYQERAAFALPV